MQAIEILEFEPAIFGVWEEIVTKTWHIIWCSHKKYEKNEKNVMKVMLALHLPLIIQALKKQPILGQYMNVLTGY